jgi:predicted RNase H-like nuclease
VRGLGADAAGKAGWVGVVVDDGGFASAHLAPTLAELIALAELGGAVDAIGVDIPIGLVDAPKRTADVASRSYVGPRRSSVFAAPHPAVVHLEDYDEVNRVLRSLGLDATSRQAFGLFARVREAAALAADPRVVEVFPEASFRAMGESFVLSSKKTWNGAAERLARLATATPSIVLPPALGAAGDVAADDVFDAAAAGWSAWRVAQGQAVALGDPGEIDPVTSRRIAVWV